MSARRLQGGDGCEQVHVELAVICGDGAGEPVVEATALLADGFPPAPAPAPAELHDARPSRWQAGELYEEAMFHQPLWQGVRSVERVGSAGAQAELEVLARRGLLRDQDDPDFVLDPVMLDAAGQVVGFWAADTLERGQVVFPFRLAALEVFGPTPPAGERLSCVAAISREGEHLLSSDIDVLDGDGRCWMRLTGWEDKRFAVPERFAPLARPARLAALSTPWHAPQSPYPDGVVVCRSLDARLPVDRGLWMPAWAGRVLGAREREIFAALQLPETRRLEWLAARTAGKECVAELTRAAHGLDLLHAEIEILPDERGAPVVICPALERLGGAPRISLTHTGGQAAALAAFAPAGGGVGIDVERLRAACPGVRAGRPDRRRAGTARAVPAGRRRGVAAAHVVRTRGGREGAGNRAARRAARVRDRRRTARRCCSTPPAAGSSCGPIGRTSWWSRPPSTSAWCPRRQRDDESGPAGACRRSSPSSRRRRATGSTPGRSAWTRGSWPISAWSRWRS